MANGNIDPSKLSAFGQYLLSGESDLEKEDLQNALAQEVSLAQEMSAADAAIAEAKEEQGTNQGQPQATSVQPFMMSPFGTQAATPFLFGEDPASQEAQESFQSASDVAQQLIGLQDPRSEELIAQQEEEGVQTMGGPVPFSEAFVPFGAIPKGMKALGGLQKLSRFKPSATPSQLPVLRGGQQPSVFGGNQLPATVTTPPSTFVRGTGPKRITGEVLDVPKGGGLIPSLATLGLGGAFLADKAMQDPSQGQGQESVAVAPTEPQPTLTTVPGLEGGFGGMGLSEFLAPERAKQEAARSSFEQASREREARLSADEFARSAAGREASQEEANRMAKLRSLARQKGFKGSAVDIAAEMLGAEEERKAAESKALTEARERQGIQIPTALKDLSAVEKYFEIIGVPFRGADGNLTNEAKEAIAARGRLGEGALGSGLELTDELARQYLDKAGGNKEEARRLAKEAGYTVS